MNKTKCTGLGVLCCRSHSARSEVKCDIYYGETFGVSLVDLIYVNCQVMVLSEDHGSAALPMKFDRP
jgi:hypothetical protein